MEDVQSQYTQGPFLLSFGDLHRQINQAKKAYDLSVNEFLLLHCFIQTMPRPGYKTSLGAVFRRDAEFWVESTGMMKTNLFRTFRSLMAKKVIVMDGDVGKKKQYFLHPEFFNLVASEKVSTHSPVENSKNCDQPDHRTVINLDINCDQPDHRTVINLDINCDQPDYSASYIEDSLLFPKDSLTLPSSIPAVDNVDNFSEDEKRLAQYFDADKLERAKAFIEKLKPLQLERLSGFLKMLEREKEPRDVKGMNLAWARWFYMEDLKPSLNAELQSPQNLN